jgi:hypothetical protein
MGRVRAKARGWGDAGDKRTISPPGRSPGSRSARPGSRPPLRGGMAPPEWQACACISDSHFKQPAGKRQRSGKSSAPGRRPSCPPRKRSRRVKRRKALVRKPPHPVATLRSGQSLHRKGLPAHDAGRRALRRFTAVISVEPRSTRSGRAFLSGLLFVRPVVQQAPCTRVVLPAGTIPEAPRGVRLTRPGPAGTAPHSTNSCLRLTPSNERGCGMYRTKQEHVNL